MRGMPFMPFGMSGGRDLIGKANQESEVSEPIRNTDGYRTKKETRKSLFFVVPTGIEPVTQGFSVLCSTN